MRFNREILYDYLVYVHLNIPPYPSPTIERQRQSLCTSEPSNIFPLPVSAADAPNGQRYESHSQYRLPCSCVVRNRDSAAHTCIGDTAVVQALDYITFRADGDKGRVPSRSKHQHRKHYPHTPATTTRISTSAPTNPRRRARHARFRVR